MSDRGLIGRLSRTASGLAAVLAAALAVAIVTPGCSSSRGHELREEASRLAQQGRYDEAIGALERAHQAYEGEPEAKEVEKQITLYRGLLESERKEKRRRANEDLIALGRSLHERRVSTGHFPASIADLAAPGAAATVDPWGRPYRYLLQAGGSRYKLGCLGADGQPGGEGDDQDLLVDTGEFSKDLAWEDK